MKTIFLILIYLSAGDKLSSQPFVKESALLDAGRISSWFQNFGVFDQDTGIL